MQSVSKSKKRRRIIIKKKKTKKYDYTDSNGNLTFDPEPDDEDIVKYLAEKKLINFELISKLPKLNCLDSETECEDEVENNSQKNEDLEEVNNEPAIPEYIDYENLLKDFVGGNIVYYDYSKNMIYDETFNVIGTITEEGEIDIEEKYQTKFKALVNL